MNKFIFNLYVKYRSQVNWFKYELKHGKVNKLRDLATYIGSFYLSLQKGLDESDYQKARDQVSDLGISNLNIQGNKISITLMRPGLLIGRKGENIDQLQKYLNAQYKKNMKIKIIEERILEHLFPYHYDDCIDELEDY